MKKYIVIITEDNGDYQFDYLCDNPWHGNFRDVIYGDNTEEIVSDGCNGDYEGLFYQLYETNKGKRIGYGVFNYDAISEDIIEYVNMNGIIIDGDLYMIRTVEELATYTVSNLNYSAFTSLTDDDHKFIDCDFCTIDLGNNKTSIEKIIKEYFLQHGIKAIEIGFASSNVDIAVDCYGGGCLHTVSLDRTMNKKQCIDFVKEIIKKSFEDNGECVKDGTLLLVGVKNATKNSCKIKK